MFGPNEVTPEEEKPALTQGGKLDFLQRQSWQLELIITGFALAGMISGAQEFHDLIARWRDITNEYPVLGNLLGGILRGIYLAYFVTIFHFFLNVVIRCLWIGALALRNTLNKEAYLNQKFHPLFENFLQKRHGDFDRYIVRLDKAASMVFAFTFLMIAILFGLMLWGSLFGVIVVLLTKVFGLSKFLGGIAFLIYAGIGLLYLLDFVTAGSLKKGAAKVYYPIYRALGWLTLARIYRPLYYAILSNSWGKYLILAIVPYLAIIMILPQQSVKVISFVDRGDFLASYNQESVLKNYYYEDAVGFRETKAPIIIKSDVIVDKVLRVRLPLRAKYGEALTEGTTLPVLAEKQDEAEPVAVSNSTPDSTDIPRWQKALDEYNKLTNPLRMLKSKQDGEEQQIQNESEKAGRRIGEGIARNFFGRGFSELAAGTDSLIITNLLKILELNLDGELVDPANVLLSVGYGGTPIPELIAYFPLHDKSPGMHEVSLREFREEESAPGNLQLFREYRVPFFYAPE